MLSKPCVYYIIVCKKVVTQTGYIMTQTITPIDENTINTTLDAVPDHDATGTADTQVTNENIKQTGSTAVENATTQEPKPKLGGSQKGVTRVHDLSGNKYTKYDLYGIAERLRTQRLLQRYTQKQIADMMGTTQPYYSLMENARGVPDHLVEKAAEVLGLSLDFVLYGNDNPPVDVTNNHQSTHKPMVNTQNNNTGFINNNEQAIAKVNSSANNQSIVNNRNTYNFHGQNVGADSVFNGLSIQCLPVLDAELAAGAILDNRHVDVNNHIGPSVLTKMYNDSRMVAVKAQDSMPTLDGDVIDKHSVLLVEPTIAPTHQSLVMVCLDVSSAWRRCVFGVLSIDFNGNRSIKIADGQSYPMPVDSVICGVVVRVVRDVMDPITHKQKMDRNWNVWATHQKP